MVTHGNPKIHFLIPYRELSTVPFEIWDLVNLYDKALNFFNAVMCNIKAQSEVETITWLEQRLQIF